MPKKAKQKTSFQGRWRINWMSEWDQDYVDEEVEAFIEFDADSLGSFQFGYVQGQIDFCTTSRDGQPAVEFSCDGGDGADCTPMTGRGWAVFDGGQLSGMIFIHRGDGSEFRANKIKRKK